MHTNYLQMPPESTGKKIALSPLWIIPVTDASLYAEDDILIGGTSGTTMLVKQINTIHGYVYAKYTTELQEGASWVVGENITVDGAIIGTVLSTPFVNYVNVTSLVSHDNPFHGQRVDAQGQAYIRYEEGAQILDATGKSKFSGETLIGMYRFVSSDDYGKFAQPTIVGTASATHNPDDFSVKLQTGVTTGDSISFQTHKYHYHTIGTGLLAELLVGLGDNGKTNLSREWGYADANSGMFFDLMGSELTLVIRKNGVDTHITQVDWNRDKLDGLGISGIDLDVTKINRYWFDFNRGSRFRAGIYAPNGARVVCHDVYISNTVSQLVLNSTSLPLRAIQFNTGTVISTSEMTCYEGCVKVEGEFVYNTSLVEASSNPVTCSSTDWTPLLSIRPITDSKHSIALPIDVAISAVLASDANIDGRVKFELFKNATLVASDFVGLKTGSRFNFDKAATAISGGVPRIEYFFKGTDNHSIEDHFSYLEEYLIQNADGTKNTYTLAVKALDADCVVNGAMTWKEISVQ